MKRHSILLLLVLIIQPISAQNFFYQAPVNVYAADSDYYQIHTVFNDASMAPDYALGQSKKIANFSVSAVPQLNMLSGLTENHTYFVYGLNGIYLRAEKSKKIKIHWFPAVFSGKTPQIATVFAHNQGIIPGYSFADGSDIEWQYFQLFHVKYQPNQIFSFSILNEPLKIGNGYYSLFADNKTSPYGQLRTTAQIWHLKYMVNVSFLRDRSYFLSNTNWKKKYSFTHLLSWNLSKRINFNFFETVIASAYDSTGYRGFDFNYLNPVIFYRPLEFSLGSPDNVLMGIGLNIRLFNATQLYGQILLDEFVLSQVKQMNGWWGNKQAFLGGIKTPALFGIEQLDLVGELVLIRPFVYAHNQHERVYGNKNQLLAYPNGSNTAELLAEISYEHKKWSIEILFSYRLMAKDSFLETNYGNHPYKSYDFRYSDYGNEFLQGIGYDVKRTSVNMYYYLWPRLNLYTYLGADVTYVNSKTDSDMFSTISLGIVSNMHFLRIHKQYQTLAYSY